MKSRHKPEIRFEGFTEDWKQCQFENVFNRQDGIRRGPFGSALKKEFFVKESDYVVYEQQNAIYDNYETRYNITKEKFEELKNFQLSEGDFILSGAGTIGRISRVPKGIKPGVFNQALIRFKIDESVTDSEYFVQWIRSENMQRKLTGANPGSAITNLVPMSEVKKWDVMVPVKNEQIKIGKFFKQFDDTIAILQQELTSLKQTKKGFLQKMFPKEGEAVPEFRFPGFIGDWEQRKLSEITRVITKGTTPKVKNNEGDINFIKVENIDSDSGAISLTSKISKEEHEGYLKRSQLEPGDILFSIAGTLGRVTIVYDDVLPANTNQALAIIRLNDANVDFIATYLKGKSVEDYIRKNPTVGAQPNLSLQQVGNLTINYPSNQEQEKIGVFFKQLDDNIFLYQRELDVLQETKKAFLQKMFV